MTKASIVPSGIRLISATVDNYCRLTKVLLECKLGFYSFMLKEEKPNIERVFIRCIPVRIQNDIIFDELRELVR